MCLGSRSRVKAFVPWCIRVENEGERKRRILRRAVLCCDEVKERKKVKRFELNRGVVDLSVRRQGRCNGSENTCATLCQLHNHSRYELPRPRRV
jgi:hypothetical protein